MRFSFSGRILRGQGDRPAEPPVAFYLPDLRMGGAERVTVLLALHMVRRGRAACLILDNAEGELIPTVPAEVPVYGLGARRTRNAVVPLARLLRRLRPALLVSGMPYNNVVALAAARAVRPAPGVVLIEHGVPSLEIAEDVNPMKGVAALAARRLYRLADAVVAVSHGAAADLAAVYGLPPDRVTVIGNPVAPDAAPDALESRMLAPVPAEMLPPPGVPLFTAAGRLVPAKDFATLLRAFRLVRDRIDARLVVLGEGPERQSLEALRDGLGLDADVALPGVVPDPLPWFARSAAVVVSSSREGFGNVLVEAMACGTPVAATACPHGPAEILEQGAFGPLAPPGDAAGLAQAMLTTLSGPVDAARLKARAACFSTDRIGDAYLALFQGILDARSKRRPLSAAFGTAGLHRQQGNPGPWGP